MEEKGRPGQNPDESLGEQIARVIDELPEDRLTLGELLDVFGDEGLLLLSILLTLVFLIPVSIPGVSTIFGAAILLVGISRLLGKPLWLPAKLRERALPAEKLRPGLRAGMRWVQRMERISKPRRMASLVSGRGMGTVNNLAFILGALLLMAPFGFVPFSNTFPAVALLLFGVGFIQRDGGAILLGHLANLATTLYFGILIGGGGAVLHQIWQRLAA